MTRPGVPRVVSGRVVDADGRPVARAAVHVVAAPTHVPDVAALTDEHGRFSLTAPAPGEYLVATTADGFRGATVRVGVGAAGTRLAEVEIELDRDEPEPP